MKTNRHIIKVLFYSVLLKWIIVWPAAVAQGTDGRVIVRQSIFERVDDSVKVVMSINLNSVAFQPMAYVLLTPVVYSEEKWAELPAVLINGRQQQKAYERSVGKRRKKDNGLHVVIDASDDNRKEEHTFSWMVRYEPWMAAAEFHLREDQCDCSVYPIRMSYEILVRTIENAEEPTAIAISEPQTVIQTPVADSSGSQPVAQAPVTDPSGSQPVVQAPVTDPDKSQPVVKPPVTTPSESRPVVQSPGYNPKLSVSYIVPEAETVKQHSESGRAFLDFPVAQSVLMPEFKDNATELKKINDMIRAVQNNPDATITGIRITGYASPDGIYRTNLELSGKRAEALKNYIKTIYGFNDSLFIVSGRGADWEGLDSLLQQSNIPYKDQALKIIRGTGIFDGRRKELMALASGVPYRRMLRELFPLLRRCEYELQYTVRPFTVEKGKEVFRTYPSSLSLNEMFLIAETYRKGSNEFNDLFEAAVRVFPDNDVANINAAAAALDRKDVVRAKQYLDKVKKRSVAFLNNMGVMVLMQGYYGEAIKYFSEARDLGSSEAAANLEEVKKAGRR